VLAKVPWWRLHPGRDIELVFGKPIPVSPVTGDEARHSEVQRLLEETRVQIAAALDAGKS